VIVDRVEVWRVLYDKRVTATRPLVQCRAFVHYLTVGRCINKTTIGYVEPTVLFDTPTNRVPTVTILAVRVYSVRLGPGFK
jgi:hypothetical protein